MEHWHGSENPATTTMTINVNRNGRSETKTAIPDTSVMNTPRTSLPGCLTNNVVAAYCPNEWNTYLDWVIYDYYDIPCAVPVSFTIISGNTVFTEDACRMYPLTVAFTLPCGVGTEINLICVGYTSKPSSKPSSGPTDLKPSSLPSGKSICSPITHIYCYKS